MSPLLPPPAMGAPPPPELATDGQMGDPGIQMAQEAPQAAPFPSLDPGQMAAAAMTLVAQMAGQDESEIQQLLMAQYAQFKAAQEQTLAQMPDAIAAIVAQLSGPPPSTLDGPAGAEMEPASLEEPAMAQEMAA